MKQILRSIIGVSLALAMLLPAGWTLASTVNGPLTYNNITVTNTPAVAGKDKVTITGSGFLHIEQVLLVQQGGSTNNVFNIHNYSLTDTKVSFTIPSETQAGWYAMQVNTDDNTGRSVMLNDQTWLFEVKASGSNGFKLLNPNGGESYKIGDKIDFEWDSSAVSAPYKSVYLTLSKLKGTSWSTSGDAYQYIESGSYLPILSGGSFDDGEYTWEVPTGITPGKYVAYFSIQYWTQPSNYDISSLADWSDQPFTLTASTPASTPPAPSTPLAPLSSEAFTDGAAHAIGTNVVTKTGVVYRITEGPNRSAYTSANIFLSYKFNRWSEVVQATTGDLALSVSMPMPPRDGTLFNDKGTVYIISEGKARQPFGSASVFLGYGYNFKHVYPSETGYLEMYPALTSSNLMHPDGTLINHNGTLYIMNSRARLGVPSVAVLESWGYWVEDAVPANSFDLKTEVNAVLQLRPYSQYRY